MGCCSQSFVRLMKRMKDILGCSEIAGENRQIWKALLAEAMGTMFLVLVGCASCVEWNGKAPSPVAIALAFGVTLAAMAQAIGHVSGCHINPAVTAGFLITGKITIVRAIFYVAAQCIGATAGAACLECLTPEEFHGALGVTSIAAKVSPSQGFGVEFFATFTLVLVIFAVCDENRTDVKGSAPLAIGLVVTMQALAFGSYTGCSMNPARSLGPAIIKGKFEHHWVYWVGPILGGIVAALLYENAFKAHAEVECEDDEEQVKPRVYHFKENNRKGSFIAEKEKLELIVDRQSSL